MRSPLGRGFLAGRYRSPDDLKEGDFRRTQPRFQGESFYLNLAVVDAVVSLPPSLLPRVLADPPPVQNEIAAKKGVTPAQLALAYIMGMSDKVRPLPPHNDTHIPPDAFPCAGHSHPGIK